MASANFKEAEKIILNELEKAHLSFFTFTYIVLLEQYLQRGYNKMTAILKPSLLIIKIDSL